MRIVRLVFLALFLAVPTLGQALVVGFGNSTNGWPFSSSDFGPATRYQQVYDSAQFSGLFAINNLRFYVYDGSENRLPSGTFTLNFSTTTKAVDGLNTTDFDANVGSDQSLFTVKVLRGGNPQLLDFFGDEFVYDPTKGNLLLDIVTDITGRGGMQFLSTRNAGGVYSRAHNFGEGFDGMGLVTGFNEASVVEPGTFALVALGLFAAIRTGRGRVI